MSWPDWSVWGDAVRLPVEDRSPKPRSSGRTMVIDKGIGLRELRDLLEVCAPFIDYIKLAFGTSALYTPEVLREKVRAIRISGVHVYPGGTLFELAAAQGRAEEFVARAKEIGFTCLEVSDGTFDVPQAERRRRIDLGLEAGLIVITEVGKKDRKAQVVAEQVVRQVELDLAWGADMAIVEGREMGVGVGVYDESGSPKEEIVDAILNRLSFPDRVMWEAPIPSQQQYWLRKLGSGANLGNVQTSDVLSLEATRVALRGDTLKSYARRYSEGFEAALEKKSNTFVDR